MSTPIPPKKELLESVKNGDLAAFEEILFLYEKPIFNYIFRLVGRKEDAEDLTQETFLKLHKSVNLIDFEGNFKSWLYKIATNTAYDWLRKKSRKKELFIFDNDTEQHIETIAQEPTYYNIENAYDIEKALRGIKPTYKTVLLLFYYEDLDYNEISKILSVPINTVKTYLRRARLSLKKELENKDHGKRL